MTQTRSRCVAHILALVLASLVAMSFGAIACGMDVDLGGAPDGGEDAHANDASLDGFFDAGTSEDGAIGNCEPCTAASVCQSANSCVALDGGNPYCLVLCEAGAANACETGKSCASATSIDGKNVSACAPISGACPTATGPQNIDGAPVTTCDGLIAPEVDAGCYDCEYDCQKNGCYAGYWCDPKTKDCAKPPKTCN